MWQTWFALCNFPIFSYLFSVCWKNVKVHHKLISLLRDYFKVVIKTEIRDASSWNRECCFPNLNKNQPFFVKFFLWVLILEEVESWRGERPGTWHRATNHAAAGGNGWYAHRFHPRHGALSARTLCCAGGVQSLRKGSSFFFINTVTSERQLHIDETERTRPRGLLSVQVHVLISQAWDDLSLCSIREGLPRTVTLHANQA